MNLRKLFFAAIIFSVAKAQAATYYLSPSGNDANAGTLAKPWKTLDRLQAAQSILRPGDTVYFRGGNYLINDSSINNQFYWSAKGTASARITYKKYGSEVPVILYDRRKISLAEHKTAVFPGEYTTIDGLTIRQTEASRRLALNVNGVSYTSQSNYFAKNVRAMFITTRNVILRNSVIDNFSSVGLAIKGVNALVERNTFTNSSNHIWYLQTSYGTYRYNTLDGSRQIPGGGIYGVQLQYDITHHNQIYGNLIKNTAAAAFVLGSAAYSNQIYNNVLVNPGRNSNGSTLLTMTTGSGNRFYNNTAIGKSGARVIGFNSSTHLASVVIRDNIFYPSSSVKTGLTQNYSNIRNNIFYNISDTVPSGNKKANPMLVSPLGTTAASAAPRSGSPAINAGLSSDYPRTDYSGKARPARYDVGAFEY